MIPSDVQRRVAHLDVLGGMIYSSSVRHWHDNADSHYRWLEMPTQTEPVLIGAHDAIIDRRR